MLRDNERKASQECRPREGKRERRREMCTGRRRRERLDITFAVIWERKYEDDQRNMKMDTRMSYKRQDYQATIRDVERK